MSEPLPSEDELFLSDLGEHTCPGSVCNRCAGGNLVRRYRRLEAELDALRDWVADASHQPGCSGGFSRRNGVQWPCKCGLTELRGRA